MIGSRFIRRDEAGAFIVIWALMGVVLMTMAAIVVDLGQDRSLVRSTQSLADFAALAAGADLAGITTNPSVSNPQLACADPLGSITRNEPIFQPPSTPCSTFPPVGSCINTAQGAQAATPQQTYGPVSSGGITVTIVYPVDSVTITDSRFSGGSGSQDGSRCDRMKVTVARASTSFFRGILAASPPTLTASAVVTGAPSATSLEVAALILLDRTNCGLLTTSGGGNSAYGVVLQYAGNSDPGRVHADSAGLSGPDGNCTTNNNAGGYVVYGTGLPGGGGPSIIAQDAPDGTPGVMGIYSQTAGINGRGGAVYPGGIYPAASADAITSRKPIDDRYNNAFNPSGAAISALYATAGPSSGIYTSAPAGYATSTNCTPADGTVFAGDIWMNCTDFQVSNNRTVQFTGGHVIFAGRVSVPGTLALPSASSISVRGCVSGCSGGNNYSVNVSGTLLVNTGNGATQTACSSRTVAAGVGWTVLTQAGGPFLVTGHASLCQTFVYMGDVAPERQNTTSYAGTPYVCTSELPCPTTVGVGSGYINVSGGSGDVDWSAPNQVSGKPTAASPYDDMAFWSESSNDCNIKGQGASRTEGVFFMSNAHGFFTGQAAQSVPLNAQFIARAFDLSGQGSLNLKPNPADAVPIPVSGTYTLIR